MLDIYIEEHRQILFALIKHQVNFMLIGGYAVIHYGYDRGTGDIDIWLQTGNENRDKLIEALKDFNIIDEHIETLKKMDFTNPVPVFFFGEQPRQIDFLTVVSNLKFEEAIKEVNYFSLENIKIPIIQYHHLIDIKKNTGRMKDRADIEELEKINKYRKE